MLGQVLCIMLGQLVRTIKMCYLYLFNRIGSTINGGVWSAPPLSKLGYLPYPIQSPATS